MLLTISPQLDTFSDFQRGPEIIRRLREVLPDVDLPKEITSTWVIVCRYSTSGTKSPSRKL